MVDGGTVKQKPYESLTGGLSAFLPPLQLIGWVGDWQSEWAFDCVWMKDIQFTPHHGLSRRLVPPWRVSVNFIRPFGCCGFVGATKYGMEMDRVCHELKLFPDLWETTTMPGKWFMCDLFRTFPRKFVQSPLYLVVVGYMKVPKQSGWVCSRRTLVYRIPIVHVRLLTWWYDTAGSGAAAAAGVCNSGIAQARLGHDNPFFRPGLVVGSERANGWINKWMCKSWWPTSRITVYGRA